jgi:hypothetical protein
VRLLFHTRPSEALQKLERLAAFLGISVERIDVAMVGSLEIAMREAISATERGIVLDLASLEHKSHEEELRALAASFATHDVAVLLLVSHSTEASAKIARLLASNAISGLGAARQVSKVTFSADSTRLSGELSSYSYPRNEGKAAHLILSPAADSEVVMMLDGSPTFVCVNIGEARIFVWITDGVFDVFRPLAAEIEFEQAADQYIPAVIFLRFAFGEQCWHNPSPGAGIVIDDPLLRKSYGFIKFPQLLESARRHKYHITLAFIPWNHWRSRAKEAQMFLHYSDSFSVCAHGCDHTNNEFRSTDYEGLLHRSFIASQRMDRHRERTGLPSEPLMVCPQEQYSLEAMRAFGDSRQFLGLVCTACMPRNLTSPQISGADLLLPAQDSFYGFPVFKRHYWNGMEAFAMALFLGKPAILVEHHEFFRNGSGGAEEFVRRLAELRPDLKWNSLAETVTTTHARRQVSEGKWEVRFFTDTFQLEHKLEQLTEFRLLRRIPETTHVQSVRVGGREVPFSRENGFLTLEVSIHRPQMLTVEVKVTPVRPTKTYSCGVKYQASVALRRGLSEFRDNVTARNRFILGTSRRLMKSIKHVGC